jgi:cyclophilin family peptidyl-prolyl cis-trans isomerase
MRTLVSSGLLLFLFTGCGGEKPKSEGTTLETPKVAVNQSEKTEPAKAEPKIVAVDPKFQLSFGEAAILDEIPEDQQAPPDRTLAGKATGPLRTAVEKLWPLIVLHDEAGKPIPFVVQIETSLGEIEISLRTDLAPNHIRNWLALIKTNFYDGLCFDRIVKETFMDSEGKKQQLELIRGGCPLGTGEPGIGHLGYFMKPEFTPSEKHAEGTVGFWRDSEPTSAGCRFYITLTPAITLDGEYSIVGKVTKGLDVVRKIADATVKNPDHEIDREKPKEPVTIKKITFRPDRVEWSTPVALVPEREIQR